MNETRLGLFGGTFDPVHCGHAAVARRALEHGLDRIVVVPARLSPHKLPGTGAPEPAPVEHRWRMLELAFASEARVELSRMEIDRPGASYTCDTIAALHERSPAARWVLILGADQLPALPRWARFPEWAASVDFLVFSRKGVAPDTACPDLRGLNIELIRDFAIPASATDIRNKLAQNTPVSGLLPPDVEKYIRQHRLYGAAPADA